MAWKKRDEKIEKEKERLQAEFAKLVLEGKYETNEYYVYVEQQYPPPEEPEEIDCPVCDAEGMIPTQEGNDVLELIRKFL